MKKTNKKGFTLMEMLIVVAIIAILIAIAIPTFTKALEGARESTDKANIRAAYASVMSCALTGEADGDVGTDKNGNFYLGVKATQKVAGWQENGSETTATIDIANVDVAPTVAGAKKDGGWTVTYNETLGTCEVTAKYTAPPATT